MPTRTWIFSQNVLGIFRSTFFALLPSYVRRRLRNESVKPARESPTSYLNGFRGIMAYLVFVRHFSLPWQPDLDYGFGQGENHTGIFRLPVLRVLYSGPYVAVFLVVSGYVMSLKPLRLISADQKESFLTLMISSVFRRAIRILLPPIISTFIYMLVVHFGLFKPQYHTMDTFIPHHPNQLSTFFDQFKDWLQFVFGDLTNPWSWNIPRSVYGPHLWTTGLQFRSSMVLFLVLLGLANTQKRIRQPILAFLFVYCMSSGRWDVALYVSGIFMAGTEIEDKNKTNIPVTSVFDLEKGHLPRPAIKFFSYIYWCSIVLAGLYLSSYPRARDDVGAPGFRTLYGINPSYHYWHGCGAILLTRGLMFSRAAQNPFNWSFPQYLGELSFSLYIVHEPLLHILGYGIVNRAWDITGKETNFQYQLGFFLALFIASPILLVSINKSLLCL
jgi:peptidoglycan/LPS O-acetylase OafA/YrhL